MTESVARLARSVRGGLIAAKLKAAPLPQPDTWQRGWSEADAAAAWRPQRTVPQRIWRELQRAARRYLLPLPRCCERLLHIAPNRPASGAIDRRLDRVAVFQVIHPLLLQDSTVVDIVPQDGLFTAFAIGCIAPGGRVAVVERNPDGAALLRRTLHLHGVADRVDVRELQTGDVGSLATVLPDPASISVVRIAGDAVDFDMLSALRRLAETNPRLAILVEFEAAAFETAQYGLAERIAMIRALGFELWQIDTMACALQPLRDDPAAARATMALLLLCRPVAEFPELGVA